MDDIRYIIDFQYNMIRTFQKSRDIALWWASCLLTNVFLLYFCIRETDTLCVIARRNDEAIQTLNQLSLWIASLRSQ